MTEIEAIRARHAVRNYTAKPLSPEIIDELSQEIEQCNRQGQLHIQLVTENAYNAKKCPVTLAPDEELVGVIAIGYGTTDGTQHKSKSMERLCKPCSDKWFTDGMNAAVLAPTGLNRQNFFIEANGNTVSIRTKDNHPMSQINTGIVKYHFEIGAGRENFNWE